MSIISTGLTVRAPCWHIGSMSEVTVTSHVRPVRHALSTAENNNRGIMNNVNIIIVFSLIGVLVFFISH